MRAINDKGQNIINQAKNTRENNKLHVIGSLRDSIIYIEHHKFESAKESLLSAYGLIHESLGCTYICGEGLQSLVTNELIDAQNYNYLDMIKNNIYGLYESLFHLVTENYNGKNIYSFLKYKILQGLNRIYSEVLFMDPLYLWLFIHQ